jgi:exonuclease SbcD
VGGNHDSPSFLEAPAKLLKGLGVHVLGASSSDSQREVLALRDLHGQLELVVCAVPFLREADLRLAEMGDSDDDRHKKIIIGLTSHYQKVADLAKDINNQNQSTVPVIATGHLFLSGSTTLTDDGVREIHAGQMSARPLEILPNFDYLALGHLHTAQLVGKKETVRYSGSPIPMGFNEAAQKKSICLIEFEGLTPQVEQIEVPVFQPIKRLQGDLKALISQIKDLKGTKAWLEIIHTGTGLVTDLRRQLDEASTGLDLEILAVKDNHLNNLIMSAEEEYLSLNDLSLEAIFDRLLKDSNTPEEERPALRTAHAQLVAELESNDVLAE